MKVEEPEKIADGRLEGEENLDHSSVIDELLYPAAEVRVEKVQYSILHLRRLCQERKELVIDPDFQRNAVWTAKQSSELIESILMGIPIPLIYLFEAKNGKKQVVDGRQRISAILHFLSNGFKLTGLNVLCGLNGCKFEDLDVKLQGVFEDYQLFFYIIQPPTPERVKYDIFDRVNRGGTKLNNQEMRNALYPGEATQLLKRIGESSAFIGATGSGVNPKRMRDRYVVLRSLAFLIIKCGRFNSLKLSYRGDMDDFLAQVMMVLNEMDEIDRSWLEDLMLSSLTRISHYLGNDSFRFDGGERKRAINMPLMESLVYLFSSTNLFADHQDIAAEIDKFKRELDSSGRFRGNVDSSLNVSYRFEKVQEFIQQLSQ